jgi:hypothetical protein
MRKMLSVVLGSATAFGVLLLPAPALANEAALEMEMMEMAPSARSTPKPAKKDGYAVRTQTIVIGDDDPVVGVLVNPNTDRVTVDPTRKQPSLIKLRTHFVPEMLKLSENL